MLLFFGLIDCSDVPVEIIAMVTNDCVFDGIFRRFHSLPELVKFFGLSENLRTHIFDAIDTIVSLYSKVGCVNIHPYSLLAGQNKKTN